MLSLPAALEASIKPGHHTLFFASCWRIVRTDGTIYRLTDCNSKLTLDDGQQFQPAGGFSASARKKDSGLKTNSLELNGIISDDVITNEDMRAGRYRDAVITEYLVDSMVPWMGAISTDSWTIIQCTWTGQQWEAEIADLSRSLRQNVGIVVSRTCRHVLGDALCGVNLAPLTVTGTVTAIDTARQKFQSDLTTQPDNYWKYGKLTWATGLNAGFTFVVQKSVKTNGVFYLPFKTPFVIAVGDTYTVYPGCNKTLNDCISKANGSGVKVFNNVLNFGGFPWVPGNDKMLEYPNAK